MVESTAVDDLDQQLAQCLATDGRAPFSAIAEVLGVSDQTVARRYRRLRSAGLVRVVGLKWAKAPGTAHWFLRLRCVPGSGEAIATALAQRADTAWVQLLSGDTEVLCALREQGPGRAESLLTRLPRSGRIVEVGAFSRLHIFTSGPDALGYIDVLPAERLSALQFPACAGPPDSSPRGSGAQAPVQITELDNALFAALALDGRTPYADLATATGWSETRVRRRMDQLRAAGMLYFKLELDLPAFGFRNATWLWLSVPPSYLAETGAALAKFPEVAHAIATTGPANLAACAVCRDAESLYQFLTVKVGGLPGVERLETSPIIRTVKQASPVMLPGPVAR
ncbi:MAG TPA: AsnC family transcriptional regulator [Streptosporangiaceae bacterium]